MATTFCSAHCRDSTFSIHEMSRRRQKKVRRRERGEIRRSSLGWRGKLEAAANEDAVNSAPLLNHVLDVKYVARARTRFCQYGFTYDYPDMNKVEQTEHKKNKKTKKKLWCLEISFNYMGQFHSQILYLFIFYSKINGLHSLLIIRHDHISFKQNTACLTWFLILKTYSNDVNKTTAAKIKTKSRT